MVFARTRHFQEHLGNRWEIVMLGWAQLLEGAAAMSRLHRLGPVRSSNGRDFRVVQ